MDVRVLFDKYTIEIGNPRPYAPPATWGNIRLPDLLHKRKEVEKIARAKGKAMVTFLEVLLERDLIEDKD